MYDRMMPALGNALKTEERAFYNGISAINHTVAGQPGQLATNWSLSESDMSRVFTAAKAYHDRIMSGHGWPTP
jgi:hypothetical protein